jgi:hypothetical protein
MKGDIVKCAYGPCEVRFVQTRKGHIYHSQRCKCLDHKDEIRAYQRTYYKKDLITGSEYNPYPVTRGTIFTTVACLEKGEKIQDIEKAFQRKPGQLKEIIERIRKNGQYDQIVRYINRRIEPSRHGVMYCTLPQRPMHQSNLMCHNE